MFKKKRIDLHQTPYLNWRWRVDKPLHALDEKTKSGDDYGARIYVVIDGGLFFWNTKAINYVWASASPAGNSGDSIPRTANVRYTVPGTPEPGTMVQVKIAKVDALDNSVRFEW